MAMASKPRIAFYTEAGPELGYGHLMRCHHLVEYFSSYFEVEFWLQGSIPHWFHSEHLRLKAWRDELLQLPLGEDVVLMDSYLLSQEQVFYLERSVRGSLYFIDDYPYRTYERSVQIDWTPRLFPPAHPRGLWGLEYCVLSRHIVQKKTGSYNPKSNRIAVLANLNSVPQAEELKEYLQLLIQNGLELVLLGNRFEQGFEDLKAEVRTSYSSSDLCLLSEDLRMVLSPGGQTLYEICALGLPCMAYMQTPDQAEDLQGFSQLQMVRVLTREGFGNAQKLALQTLEFWGDEASLARQRKQQKEKMDLGGVQRILKAVCTDLGLEI